VEGRPVRHKIPLGILIFLVFITVLKTCVTELDICLIDIQDIAAVKVKKSMQLCLKCLTWLFLSCSFPCKTLELKIAYDVKSCQLLEGVT